MADVVSKEKRSSIMSLVKSSNTKPEVIVRKFLFSLGFRYTLHNKNLVGKPDIVLKKHKTVIFVNGCFWHGHATCGTYLMPKTNKKFWNNKIENNIRRDKRNMRILRKDGWKVITVWECQLKNKIRDKTLAKIVNQILR